MGAKTQDIHQGRGKRSGYSLIELLIASSLLIIMIIGTGQMILLSWRFKMRADAASEAADLASSRVEALRPNLTNNSGISLGSDVVVPSGRTKMAFDLTWSTKDHSPGLRVLEIHCSPRSLPQKGTSLMVYLSATLGF